MISISIQLHTLGNRLTIACMLLFMLFPTKYSFAQIQLPIEKELNIETIQGDLKNLRKLPETSVRMISLPLEDGKMHRFHVTHSPILGPDLATKYPDISTYTLRGIDKPILTGRMSLTPLGIEAFILGGSQPILIQPKENSKKTYRIRTGDGEENNGFFCGQKNSSISPDITQQFKSQSQDQLSRTISDISNGTQSRTYRLAVIADGRFFLQNQGTSTNPNAQETNAMSVLVNGVNAISAIYERELAIEIMLTRSRILRDELIPIDLEQIAERIEREFPDENAYDLGHLWGGRTRPGSNGEADLGVVCKTSTEPDATSHLKARGFTLGSDNTTIGFYGLVAHEFGHMFGAHHTFNGTGESCTDNISDIGAYEIGSGSTIMSYPGACRDDQNISGASRRYFHHFSLFQMIEYINNQGDCVTPMNNGNIAPVVNANPGGTPIVIPKRTPFTLTGSGSDGNGDAISYTWEQLDEDGEDTPTQGRIGANAASNPLAPLFRSFPPNPSPSRSIPELSYILDGNNNGATFEALPQVGRTITMVLTGRDNYIRGGGVSSSTISITVDPNAGPFEISSQNSPTTFEGGSSQTISWDVAGTNANQINVANVKISMSVDGGQSFPYILAANAPNNGSASVTIPDVKSTSARIKIEAIEGIFFDINNADITITSDCLAQSSSILPDAPLALPVGDPGLNLGLRNVIGSSGNSKTVELNSSSPVAPTAVRQSRTNQSCIPNRPRKYGTFEFGVTKTGTYRVKYDGDLYFAIFQGNLADFDPNNPCSSNMLGATGIPEGFDRQVELTLIGGETYLGVGYQSGDGEDVILNFSGPGDIFFVESASENYVYSYLAVNASDNTIAAVDEDSDFSSLLGGSYKIYGISYKNGGTSPPNDLIPSTFIGQSLASLIGGNNCVLTSANFKELIVEGSDCEISAISLANISECNDNGTPDDPADDTFTADVRVTFSNAPATGTLNLTGDGSASVEIEDLGSAMNHTFTGISMSADGGEINLTAAFSAEETCTFTNDNAGAAPEACSAIQSTCLAFFTAPDDLPIDAGKQKNLRGGLPAGGTYSGPGVTDNGNGTFDFAPALAGEGTHTLTYESIWSRIGEDIIGEPDSYTGSGVSMSEDGNRVAVAANTFSRVYEWKGTVWEQLGDDFTTSTNSIKLAPDGNRLAIYDGTDTRIYDWNNTAWVQRGTTIEGRGLSFSFSGNGDRIAIGDRLYEIEGALFSAHGRVRVYDLVGTDWVQQGADIVGEFTGSDLSLYLYETGASVSLAEDGNQLAVGSPGSIENLDIKGKASVYEWNGSAWVMKGSPLVGDEEFDNFGRQVSLSSDGQLAIGAPCTFGSRGIGDYVRVYAWEGSSWVQQGDDIEGRGRTVFGQNFRDYFGLYLSFSANNKLAIGAEGYAQVYDWSGTDWMQEGVDIITKEGIREIYRVSLSSDGSRLALGVRSENADGRLNGMVRVYGLTSGCTVTDEVAVLPSNCQVVSFTAPDDLALDAGIQENLDGGSPTGGTYSGPGVTDNGNGTYNFNPEAAGVGTHTLSYNAPGEWTKLNGDIDGEGEGDFSGSAISYSGDGNRVAIGAGSNDGNGEDAGHVRVYEWAGSGWGQMGTDIDGEKPEDGFGESVSLSSDGNRLAAGAGANDGNGENSGHVRAYEWNGSEWVQMGVDIDGEATGDFSRNVSLSSDGKRLAIGATGNDGGGSHSGHTRVYEWNGTAWAQLGEDIDGEADDISGGTVSISSDGSRLAIGNGTISGHVAVYEWNNTAWVQLGSNIEGEEPGDWFGNAVSISADGTRLAVGAFKAESGAGRVRVFEWNGTDWGQMGAGIDGELINEWFGRYVSISANGLRVAAGTGNSLRGRVRAFKWTGTAWELLGNWIDGEGRDDAAGQVSLSADGSRMAIGATGNSDNGYKTGTVRVYELGCRATDEVEVVTSGSGGGNDCEDIEGPIEQLDRTSFYTDANASLESAGQSFTISTGISCIEGITVHFGGISANATITLNLYEGPATGTIGTPIATKVYTNPGGVITRPPDSDIPISFEFDTPVNVIEGNDYYFLLSPSCCPATFSYAFASDNPYECGSALSGLSNGNLRSYEYDLKFSVSTCEENRICANTSGLIEQLNNNTAFIAGTGTNRTTNWGQSFLVPNGVTSIDGITMYFRWILEGENIVINLYEDEGTGLLGTPLATASYAHEGERVDNSATGISTTFIFSTSVSVTPGKKYYVMIPLDFTNPNGEGHALTANNVVTDYADGEYVITTTSNSMIQPRDADLKFSIFVCTEGGNRLQASDSEVFTNGNLGLLPRFSVFPNPTERQLEVHLPVKTKGRYSLRIVDINGRTVFEKGYNLDAGMNSLQLNVSNMAEGVYMVFVSGEGYRDMMRFMKN